MKRVIFSLLVAAAVTGCAKDDDGDIAVESSRVATFTSAAIDTRVTDDGTTWEASESIGITMVGVTGSVEDGYTDGTVSSGDSNVKYVSTNDSESETVNFEVDPETSALLYPNTGSVRFYAYYPYVATKVDGTSAAPYIDGYTYSADVSVQTENIDFMVAEGEIASRTTGNVAFEFKHMFAKLTIKIECNENVTDLATLTASVTGLNTKGEYSIKDGTKISTTDLSGNTTAISFVMTYDADSSDVDQDSNITEVLTATATAIILPEMLAESASVTVTFTLSVGDSSRTFTVAIPAKVDNAATEFKAGYNHIYNVALGNDYATFTNGSIITGWDADLDGDGGNDDDTITIYPEETTTVP